MTITELNEMTRDDLIAIDNALVMLARYERRSTGNTILADRATKAINRIATRYDLVDTSSE